MLRANRLPNGRILALSLLALLAGAGSVFADAASGNANTDIVTPTVRIRYERMQDGCVITGHGTAFGVDLARYGYQGKRYLLTAAHNVLDDKHKPFSTLKIEIRYADGREMWTPVRALVWDDQLDLCIIESSADLPSLTQLSDTDLNVGSSVLLVGSPRGVPIAQFQGSVTSRFYNATVRTATRIPFDHGDSGGPFFCARTRKVVGVAVAGVPKDGDLDHNIGLFVPMAGVASFLEQNARVKVEPMAIAIESRPTTIPVAKPIANADVTPNMAAIPAVAVNPKPVRAPVFIDDESKSEVVELPAPRAQKSVARDPLPTPAPQIKTVAAAPAPVIQPVQMRLDTGNQPAIVKAVYTVQLGDNLTAIAKRHNVSIRSLLTANELKDPNILKPGMTLNIP